MLSALYSPSLGIRGPQSSRREYKFAISSAPFQLNHIDVLQICNLLAFVMEATSPASPATKAHIQAVIYSPQSMSLDFPIPAGEHILWYQLCTLLVHIVGVPQYSRRLYRSDMRYVQPMLMEFPSQGPEKETVYACSITQPTEIHKSLF